jgi:cell division cycle 20-like protein 1, cofactor of APC complex
LTGLDEEHVIVPSKRLRKISKIPYKVLDAPALQDDFYLNLVDWSASNNLAVGLSNCIYIWSASNSKVTKLHDLGPRDTVTSVCWSKRGQHLSIGTNSGTVQIWDTTKQKLVRVLKGHEGRVGAIAWNTNILSSGSKDKSILQRDLRAKDDSFAQLLSHKQEVCGLKWSADEQQLASGGNDNKLYVWSVHNNFEPAGKFSSHLAAVKAISWSPHQHGLLASGGGTADRCIRFWNTSLMQEINSIETGSQVCNLVFSKNVNEIVSTHGYSDNAIVVWKYPSMKKVTTLTGHTMRVLYLAMSPDGENIVTGAGDETLRFWKVFPAAPTAPTEQKALSLIDPQSFSIR